MYNIKIQHANTYECPSKTLGPQPRAMDSQASGTLRWSPQVLTTTNSPSRFHNNKLFPEMSILPPNPNNLWPNSMARYTINQYNVQAHLDQNANTPGTHAPTSQQGLRSLGKTHILTEKKKQVFFPTKEPKDSKSMCTLVHAQKNWQPSMSGLLQPHQEKTKRDKSYDALQKFQQ